MSSSLSRRIFDYGLLLLALAAGGFAVWQLRVPRGFQAPPMWTWALLVGAGVVGGLALRWMEAWLPDTQPAARPAHPATWPRQRDGLICLGGAIALIAWVVLRLWPNYRMWQGTQWPWLAALALTLVGAWLLRTAGEPATDDLTRRHPAADQPPPRVASGIPVWLEVCAFVLIGVLAIVLRTYRLSDIPAGIYVDETNGAMDALYVLEGRGDSPFATGWYETPYGYIYYMALLFKVLGANHLSLKLASIIPAVLTVLAVYPLGRQLFGPPVAIAAMLFTAVSRWHLTMSRWGWNEVAPPVFQVLATFFLVRGLRERRALDFAAGGTIAGLMVYTYLSSRLALATLGLFGLYWLLADRAGPLASWRKHWKGSVLFLLAALVAVAPIAVTYITNPFTFVNRVSEISIFNEVHERNSYEPLIENVRRHLMFFHYRGDRSGKHNFPSEPETDPVTGLLFVVGLGYGLVRLRDRRRGLLWLWMLFAMVAGVFSVLHESPQAYRTLNAVPAIALLAGDVLARVARGLVWLRQGAPARPLAYRARFVMATAVMVVALAASAVWETRIYFGPQASSPAVKGSFNLTETWVATEVIAALERGTAVYLSPRFYDFTPLRFLVYGVMKAKTGENTLNRRPYRLARPEVDLPVPDTGADALFLLDAYYWPVRDYFLKFYPTAQFSQPPDPENRVLAVKVDVPRDAIAAVQGLNAEFTTAAGQVEREVVPEVDEEWGKRDVTAARWSGGLRVEHPGPYELSSDGDLGIVIDGEAWSGKRFLGHGLHKLEVTQQRSAEQGVARLRWKPPQGEVVTVPRSAFFKVGPPREGLTARYYANETWSGEPLFTQVTPFILLFWPEGDPVYGPFSVRFTGKLRVEKPGRYTFRVMADDGARLTLDGKVLAEGLEPLRANRFEAHSDLTAGDHPIELDYYQRGGSNAMELYWQGPASPSGGPVPPEALVPEGG